MAELETHIRLFYGWRCDKRGCGSEWRLDEPIDGWAERLEAERNFTADGWSIWVSRSRRFYCPQHGPSKGSKMRQVIA